MTWFWIGLWVTVMITGHAWLLWRVTRQIQALHVQINSRMDDWMEAAKSLARAVGQKEGADLERSRTSHTGGVDRCP